MDNLPGPSLGIVYGSAKPLAHHVAREQEADLQLGVKRPVSQGWVTGTQDDVLAERSIELRLERLLDIDRR